MEGKAREDTNRRRELRREVPGVWAKDGERHREGLYSAGEEIEAAAEMGAPEDGRLWTSVLHKMTTR